MKNVRNKIDIIRKLLAEIENEDRFTDTLNCLSPNLQKDHLGFSPEQIYFNLTTDIYTDCIFICILYKS